MIGTDTKRRMFPFEDAVRIARLQLSIAMNSFASLWPINGVHKKRVYTKRNYSIIGLNSMIFIFPSSVPSTMKSRPYSTKHKLLNQV